MTAEVLLGLYELKGTLEARSTMLSHTLAGLDHLSDELESQLYKGHTLGKIEELSAWLAENARLIATVERIIKELENA